MGQKTCKRICQEIRLLLYIMVCLVKSTLAIQSPPNIEALNVRAQPIAESVLETEGEITIMLKANGTSAFPYNITIRLLDVTTDSQDYDAAGSQLSQTFLPGESSANITINVNNDTIFEGTESFQLTLASSSPDVIRTENQTTTISILDDEVVFVYFNCSNYTVLESDGEVVLLLNAALPVGGSEVTFTVDATVSQRTAKVNVDYNVTSQLSVTFEVNMTSSQLTIPIVNDDTAELTEVFGVALKSATQGVNVTNSTADIYITDDDPLNVRAQPIADSVLETEGEITIMFKANGTSAFPYNITIRLMDITTDSQDYDVAESQLSQTFLPGESSTNITIKVNNDTIFEGTESFQLTLASSSPDVIRTENQTTTISILDDEVVFVYFNSSNYTVLESDGEVVLLLNAALPVGGSEVTFTVEATVSQRTARVNVDYIVTSQLSVTFGVNMTSSQLTIPIVNDETAELTEVFGVALRSATQRVSVTNSQADVYITDDDPCPCKNGGTCVFAGDTFTCTCTEGWLGQFCQTGVANPHENVGTAVGVGVAAGVVGVAVGAVALCVCIAIAVTHKQTKV